jgi:hypothetical protein
MEKSDWNRPKPESLPRPTYWPMVLAFGIVLIPFGLITSLVITGVGLLVFIVGLAGWIGELLHESGAE